MTVVTVLPSDSQTTIDLGGTSGTSQVVISQIPEALKHYGSIHFDTMFQYHPLEKSKVFAFDKTDKVHKDVDAHRWTKSYLHTPKLDTDFVKLNKCSYMFSSSENRDVNCALPEEFEPFMEWVKQSHDMNQMTVNWYEESDYLPYHSDWEYGKTNDSDVLIITLNQDQDPGVSRTFSIKPKEGVTAPDLDICTTHGSVIQMKGNVQNFFRHGIPEFNKVDRKASRRISISFRSFEKNE
jgi:alkylated DNA repair dioxygenase AlkB